MKLSGLLVALTVCAALLSVLATTSSARVDSPFCTQCRRVVVDEKGAYIHHEPKSHRVIGWIKVGTEVYVLKSFDGVWCNVLIENGAYAVGKGGWALCDTLGGFARIASEAGANVYHAPKSRVIGSLTKGFKVYVLDSFEAEWCHVLIELNGANGGWVLCNTLDRPTP